jgi:REP element-mobilizing transposase RayT
MHAFHSLLFHAVFSTKNRERCLNAEIRPRLWSYLGGIARQNEIKAMAIGGMADHVHILMSISPTLSIAKVMQLLKGNSSKWIHETFPTLRQFSWQEGYGAFSVGISGVPDTIHYIETQEEHHRVRSFREEFEAFLQKHGLPFEPRMLA